MSHRFKEVERLMRHAAGDVFPGAVLRITRVGEVLFECAVGFTSTVPSLGAPVTPSTVFDVASLTKPVVIGALAADLISKGRLALEQTLGTLLPLGPDKSELTIAQLLSHTSGLPAWRPFGEWLLREHGEVFAGTPEAKTEVLQRIAWAPLESLPGTTCNYSDLGYILLGMAIEVIYNKPIDEVFYERVAAPLGLKRAFFCRVQAGNMAPIPVSNAEIAATEFCPVRRRVLVGEVHDDNAFLLGGVAGHAGLFCTAADVEAFATAVARAWSGEVIGPLVPDVIRTFVTFRGPNNASFVLAFDTPSGEVSNAGSRHPEQLVGHLGFTGTSFFVDLSSATVVVLLTNRVHPTRLNTRIRHFRPVLHDAVWEALR